LESIKTECGWHPEENSKDDINGYVATTFVSNTKLVSLRK